MSQQLISRNADLKRLRDEGYDIEVRGSYLLMKNVPYVNARAQVAYGTLVSELSLAGDTTIKPSHVAYFTGEYPCNRDGSEIVQIKHQSTRQNLGTDIPVNHSFSSKPPNGYSDHYEKLATYAAIISNPAHSLDQTTTPRPFPTVESSPGDDSVFNYVDTASSRAEIGAVTAKLALPSVAIVGVGGTGSYVLDLVAKTPVREIHLFDGDLFSQHNAFRSPGAPSVEELRARPLKVDYFKAKYSRMHRGIIPHPYYLDAARAEELRGIDFVFLCLDGGSSRQVLLEKLEEFGTSFIDVGMGVDQTDGSLGGILRVTTGTREKRDHVRARVPGAAADGDDAYARNIQIADLNALNAALAVVKWKKLRGFYRDLGQEYHATYTIDTSALINDDHP